MQRRIIVTSSDMQRLEQLLEATVPQSDYTGIATLERELDGAEVVPPERISKNVVTMNSRVRINDLDRGTEHVCQLVFPSEANAALNRISVLAPLGTALLGDRVGQVVRFPAPGGPRKVKITAIEYQPEALARQRKVTPDEA